eukprot:5469953-Alexandrium_andersonii.AAC.1
MSASLVGSEMCIRDRGAALRGAPQGRWLCSGSGVEVMLRSQGARPFLSCCLLYTSDAADDM